MSLANGLIMIGANAVKIVEMEQHFFRDHHSHLKMYTERNKDD